MNVDFLTVPLEKKKSFRCFSLRGNALFGACLDLASIMHSPMDDTVTGGQGPGSGCLKVRLWGNLYETDEILVEGILSFIGGLGLGRGLYEASEPRDATVCACDDDFQSDFNLRLRDDGTPRSCAGYDD
jgi:hypothetical protein